jgi:hypothetical protein
MQEQSVVLSVIAIGVRAEKPENDNSLCLIYSDDDQYMTFLPAKRNSFRLAGQNCRRKK